MEQQSEQWQAGLPGWLRRRPWVVDALFAVALAVALGAPSFPLLWHASWPVAVRVGVLALLLVAHAAVAVRRVLPLAAYGVACATMLVLVLAPDITDEVPPVPPILLPSALVFPVLLYAVAAHTRRPWPLAALGVALTGAVITTVRLWAMSAWQPGRDGVGWRLFLPAALLASVLAPWGLGRFRAVRTAYVHALEERAIRAEERRAERAEQAAAAERARIAREMHDVVAHSLAVIVRQADGGRFAAAKEPAQAVTALAAIATTGRQALTDMRAVLGVLRQDHDGNADSGTAPQPTLDDVPALVDRVRAAGTPVSLTTTGAARSLDRAASLAAYRVVQEALTNVVRHAEAGSVATVRLDWGEAGLDIAVVNGPGAGVAWTEERSDEGRRRGRSERHRHGLIGMRERVAAIGGRLSAGPRGDGFAVLAHLPVKETVA
jgi:signal transduction histidine kinase